MGRWVWANRHYLWTALIVFGVGVAIGYTSSDSLQQILMSQLSQIRDLAQRVRAAGNPWYTVEVIFLNNVKVALFFLVTGVLAGIPALLGVLGNGALIGFVMAMLHHQGLPIGAVLLYGILPHGVFEIPAFLLAAAFGLKLGWGWWRPKSGNTRKEAFLQGWRDAARAAGIAVLMLAVAAVIEGTVTPYLLSRYVLHAE
ncbi:MAG: stage II sporulation protein M [Alicyclobacillaceae bacterium]|nr:stage II sporulation protein M [Alicyclobacillaceae bacterium]